MTKKRSITILKKREYEEGSNLALENAENLLEIARHCAEKGYNGNGAAILITSIEELAKAAYLKIKAHEPAVKVNELDKFFRSHGVKHKVALGLALKLIVDVNVRTIPKENQMGAAIGVLIVLGFMAYFTIMGGYDMDLEKIRQKGYYVNFIGDEKCWESPKNLIKTEDLTKYIRMVEGVFVNVKKDLFQDQLTSINLKKYIEYLGDENVYFKKNFKFLEIDESPANQQNEI